MISLDDRDLWFLRRRKQILEHMELEMGAKAVLYENTKQLRIFGPKANRVEAEAVLRTKLVNGQLFP